MKQRGENKVETMNAYLVVLHHYMDDLPIRLFPGTSKGRRDAIEFATKTKPMPTEAIRRVFCTDCSTPDNVVVFEFVDGVPVHSICTIDF